eukprot:TRINITY_DN7235_c0_g1_i1.p1 TRINITY_DN7235_c0_g1~~TRINITY_DN7235_c0_g1_i1.p1  ORF type:complete len:362 (+),score=65.72 TRINITY_DN7235_c0_g1_i1:83-1168(+)
MDIPRRPKGHDQVEGSPTECDSKRSSLGGHFDREFGEIETLFGSWNDEEKRFALRKLMLSMDSGESRFNLLCSLEESLKFDPLDQLPPEISINIFSYLNRTELSKAAQVSKAWKSFAYDHTLLIDKLKHGSIYCLSCNSFLGVETDIICRKYRLDYSLAYVIKSLCNIELSEPEEMDVNNGRYKVSKAHCKTCKSKIGIKYLDNTNGRKDEKTNTFLVKKIALYFPGEPAHHVVLVCNGCKKSVAKDQDILDWNYVLRGGKAYLLRRMFNIQLGDPTPVHYSSGNYTVADTICSHCNQVLGVKYIEATDTQNAYKVGSYLVEKPKLSVVFHSKKPLKSLTEAKLKGKSKGIFSSFMNLFKH